MYNFDSKNSSLSCFSHSLVQGTIASSLELSSTLAEGDKSIKKENRNLQYTFPSLHTALILAGGANTNSNTAGWLLPFLFFSSGCARRRHCQLNLLTKRKKRRRKNPSSVKEKLFERKHWENWLTHTDESGVKVELVLVSFHTKTVKICHSHNHAINPHSWEMHFSTLTCKGEF